MRITQQLVDQISAPPRKSGKSCQVFYRDSVMTGFGLRVTSSGAKSFIVEKRIEGKVKRITLGRYDSLTVEQARKEAMRLLGKIVPSQETISNLHHRRIGKVTLLDAFEDYLQTRKDLKPATIHDYRRSIDGPFVNWQNKPLTDITKDMVQLRHAAMGKRSKARANNAMRVLRAVFNHAISKYEDNHGNQVVLNNPVDRLSQTGAWYKVATRQTYIKPHELADWFAATMKLNNESTRHYLYLLLFSGLRRSEASRLRWDDVNFEDHTLTVNETRNHLVHVLPLSDFLYELLKQRKDAQESPYIFPSDSERGYLVEPRTAVKRVAELSGISFTLHDLRRTFITIAESLEISGHALKRLLNHKDPSDATASYSVSNVEQLREPMQKITDFIIKNSNKR